MAASQVQTASVGVTAGQQIIPNLPASGRAGYVHLIQMAALGAATATITVYDSINSATNQIFELTVPTTWTDRYDWAGSLAFKNGLYVVVAGDGAPGGASWGETEMWGGDGVCPISASVDRPGRTLPATVEGAC